MHGLWQPDEVITSAPRQGHRAWFFENSAHMPRKVQTSQSFKFCDDLQRYLDLPYIRAFLAETSPRHCQRHHH